MNSNYNMRGRRILYVSILLVTCVLVVEGVARFLTRGPKHLSPLYLEMSQGFEHLDALIEDGQKLADAPTYYEEFLYGPTPVASMHINITDYYSARWAPDSVPLAESEHIIWAFGGSTLQNTETTDSLTIANTWAKIFNRELGPTHVKNFGTGGFATSYELIKFQKLLRQVKHAELPTIAIFYDGYNDAAQGFQNGVSNIPKNISLKLEALIEHDNLAIATYTFSKWLSSFSRFWEQTGARAIQHVLFTLPAPPKNGHNLEATVRIYISNVKMIRSICETFQIRCFFVLQPLLVTKKPLTELEQSVLSSMEEHPRWGRQGTQFVRQFYDRVTKDLSASAHFVDGSHILDGRAQSDYYDLGHTGAQTPPIIGEKIAHEILARLQANTASEAESGVQPLRDRLGMVDD